MYILFEMKNANGGLFIQNFDCMGYTDMEDKALLWVSQNPQFRCYKYCPDTKKI